MPIGWMTDLSEAEDYFMEERLETDAWDGVAHDSAKEKLLLNAYNRIYYSPLFSIPTSPSGATLTRLKKAQCEMSYYLAEHLADEDRRKGLQAQGVTDAGIVKEKYHDDMMNELAFPPFVLVLLDALKTTKEFVAGDIDRDEEQSVDTNVTDF